MDKVDYAILFFLKNKPAVTKLSAVSRKAIHTEVKAAVKVDTLYRRLDRLIEAEYAAKGIKDRREFTYYITEKGEKALEEAINER